MSLWNFLGGFALFNMICDMFSSKSKQTYMPPQPDYHDYDYDDSFSSDIDGTDIDALQDRVDELEIQLAGTDAMSDRYDELSDRIDELQERIDCLEEWEDIHDDLDDLQDELDDIEFNSNLYDDQDDW